MDSSRNRLASDLSQAYDRIRTLQTINSKLSQTIQSAQIPEYKQLLARLTDQQQSSSQTITALQLTMSQLQTKLAFHQKLSNTIVSELQQKLQAAESLVAQLKHTLKMVASQNSQLKKQLHERKLMIKNQEQLIDDYKRSIEEEKEIERQIAKCQFKQVQNKLQRQMQHQVQQIKSKHQKKLAKINKENMCHSYKKQIDNLKQFITAKRSHIKQNQQRNQYSHNMQPFSKKKGITEEKGRYSTNQTNNDNSHILIFDESEGVTQRVEEEKSREVLNEWRQKNGNQAFSNGMKSLGSTLESGVVNFKSIQASNQQRPSQFYNFDSIKLNK